MNSFICSIFFIGGFCRWFAKFQWLVIILSTQNRCFIVASGVLVLIGGHLQWGRLVLGVRVAEFNERTRLVINIRILWTVFKRHMKLCAWRLFILSQLSQRRVTCRKARYNELIFALELFLNLAGRSQHLIRFKTWVTLLVNLILRIDGHLVE